MSDATNNPQNSPPQKFTPRPAVESDEGGFPWLRLIGAAIFVLIAGGVFYQFYWKYRLPQDRNLVDRAGQHIDATLQARNGEILEYTSKKDGTTHYLAVESLSDDDQAFLSGLASKLSVAFPVEAALTTAKGEPIAGTLLARNAQYLKMTMGQEAATHYYALSDLSENDQKWIKLLPSGLTFSYPVSYTFNYPDGRSVDVRIIGRSDKLVRVQIGSDGTVHVYPVESLSAADQSFIRVLPVSNSLSYPVEVTLVTKDDKSFTAVVIGRSESTVRYNLANEKSLHMDPISQFSQKNQDFLRSLPVSFQDSFVADRTLTLPGGDTLKVHLVGRTPSLFKFTSQPDGNTRYLPIDGVSAEDQDYVRKMPADLRLDYPTEYTLIDPKGAEVPVRLLGKTGDTVKLLVLSSGKTMDSPVKTLSKLDQSVLDQFPSQDAPKNTGPAPVAQTSATPKSTATDLIIALQNSGTFGGEISTQPVRKGEKVPRNMSGSAWEWLVRITAKTDIGREDAQEFNRQKGMQDYIRTALTKSMQELKGIRTKVNAQQVDDLLSSAQRAVDGVDAMAKAGSTVNRTATDNIADFVKRWQTAAGMK